jgi:DNA helicase-2/ATP-dependent DNA helicase PcrA
MAPVGTGKTTVLTRRAANAIQNGVDPGGILCLTFTNRAAREMRDRIRLYCGTEGAAIWVGTFHAFCAAVLRREAGRLGLFADFSVYDDEDCRALLREVWEELGLKVHSDDCDRLGQIFYHCAEAAKLGPYSGAGPDLRGVFRNELSRVSLRGTVIPTGFDPAAVLDRYNRRLADNHALDFADLVARVAGLFSEDPEALARWQGRFSWIQVDEMQDTNLAEYAVISALAREHKNLALFGDFDQTVYEWRGSAPSLILRRFRQEFAPVREVKLARNYRSTAAILDACSAVIRAYGGAVTGKLACASAAQGPGIGMLVGRTPQHEAHLIATAVRRFAAAGVRYRDMAVLTRTNRYSEMVSSVFDRLGIPHLTIDRYRFFRRAEIKDAMAHLRLILNPHDTTGLRRVLERPPKGIGPAVLRAVAACPAAAGLRLADLLDPQALADLDPFAPLLEALAEGRLVVVDTETTGLEADREDVIELAAAKLGPSGELDRFHRYLRTARPPGEFARAHGLTEDLLAREGRPPEEAYADFLEFARGCVLVGHNVGFDAAVLAAGVRRAGLTWPEPRLYDTLELSRRFLAGLSRYRLADVCAALGVQAAPSHRAADDVAAACAVLERLLPRVREGAADRRRTVGGVAARFRPVAEALDRWRRCSLEERPPDLLRRVLDESGLARWWEQREDGPKRRAHLEELVALFGWFDDPALPPQEALREALNRAALGQESDRCLLGGDRVPVLTVHQAKDLEFDTVFVAGAVDGSVDGFPTWQAERDGRLDEEHRLFYVAMTRARRRLVLCWHEEDDRWRRRRSRFVDLIPARLLVPARVVLPEPNVQERERNA